MLKLTTLFTLVFFMSRLSCPGISDDLEQITLRGATMGTSYSIKIVEPASKIPDEKEIHNDVKKLLRDVNWIMSTYIDDSELSLFNQAEKNSWVEVSRDLVDLFRVAIDVSAKSNGAFDITVGPLVNLWGFGPEHNESELPSESEIKARKKLIGYEHLLLQDEPPALQKSINGIYCDLSAIAKGWGVDQVAQLFESKNLHNYLVEIGGEIRAKGVNKKNGPWRIGVSAPDAFAGIQKVIAVRDVAVATSGDYRNYFEKDGVRYSHTIDPRTGRPIRHSLASVTVIHESCMMADAYATAINVLGEKEGMLFAEKENLAVFMIVKDTYDFVEKKTVSFEQYISK